VIPHFRKWHDSDDAGTPLLLTKQMDDLSGGNEYAVDVRGPKMHHTRFVCMVNLYQYEGSDIEAWADTTTGSLYVGGNCLSGPLEFATKPKPTGRTVPNWSKRQVEGDLRTRIW
jgi:hypothetical protein